MRLALVTETFLPRVDGIVRMLLEFLTYLEAQGHEAVVVAPGRGADRCRGAQVLWVPGVPFPPYPGLIVAPYARRLESLFRAWRPDIVHLAGPFVLGAYALRVAQRLGIPAAGHYQTDLARLAPHYGLGAFAALTRRRLRAIHNGCTINFAPTAAVAAELRTEGIRNVQVVGRGVDTTQFHPAQRDAAWHARLTRGGDQPVLAYVGRVAPEKGLQTLIAVAQALPDCPLLVVGDGPGRAPLAQALAGHNVHFTGWLHGAELAAAYATADLFVFPSVTETFGQVVREAMASGLPVVGMAAGGVQDLVSPGSTGLLCRPADVADFVAATRRLVADSDLRRAMGHAARRQAEDYTWSAVFDQLLDWYTGLTSPHNGAARLRSLQAPQTPAGRVSA